MHTIVTIFIVMMLLGIIVFAIVGLSRLLRPLLPPWLVNLVTQTAVPAVQRHGSAALGRAFTQMRARGNGIVAAQTDGVQKWQDCSLRGLYDETSTAATDIVQTISDRAVFNQVRSYPDYGMAYIAFLLDGDNPSRIGIKGTAVRVTVEYDPTANGYQLGPLSYEPIDLHETFDDDENSVTFTATFEQYQAMRRGPDHSGQAGAGSSSSRASTASGSAGGGGRSTTRSNGRYSAAGPPRTRVLDADGDISGNRYPCLQPTNRNSPTWLPSEGMLGRRPEPGSGDAAPAIVIDDEYVSSGHAWLSRRDDSFVIKDLNSTNGIRVNGAKVTEAVLRHGDRVRFGSSEFLVLFRATHGGQTESLA